MQNSIVPVLSRNDISIEFTKDRPISLTAIWKMEGSPESQTPNKWKILPTTKKLIKRLEKELKGGESSDGTASQFQDIIKTTRGGNKPETAGHWKLALEYAAYLNIETKSWMLGIIGDYVESPEDFAANILLESHNKERQKKALKRVKVTLSNKEVNELSQKHGLPYCKMHDDRNVGLYGKTTKQLRLAGDVEKETPLNYLSDLDISYADAANGMVIAADNPALMALAASGIAELHQRITGKKLEPTWDTERLTPAKARKITHSSNYQMALPV
jgi:KilA-N domain